MLCESSGVPHTCVDVDKSCPPRLKPSNDPRLIGFADTVRDPHALRHTLRYGITTLYTLTS